MNSKDGMEEGEISDISDGEEPLGHYTPLERPVTAKAVLPQNANDGKQCNNCSIVIGFSNSVAYSQKTQACSFRSYEQPMILQIFVSNVLRI